LDTRPPAQTAHDGASTVQGWAAPLAGPAGPAGPGGSREQLERVRAREPRALEEFFEAYFDRVYSLVYRLLGDRTRAEDAAQDVFLKAYRSVDRIDVERDPWGWLSTIATNTCRDLWRSGADRMGRKAVDVDDPAVRDALSTGRNDPEHDLDRSERESIVQAALAELPEDLRMSVLLFDYAGVSHEEIAQMLGISHDAARKRHSRALAALGRLLEGRLGARTGDRP
jgi:RNA polymerase sigma-70 factor (ECF subfamily)